MAKPSVVSRILTCVGTHGHVVAALLEETKDVTGSGCFETCETGSATHGSQGRAAWRLQFYGREGGQYVSYDKTSEI